MEKEEKAAEKVAKAEKMGDRNGPVYMVWNTLVLRMVAGVDDAHFGGPSQTSDFASSVELSSCLAAKNTYKGEETKPKNDKNTAKT